MDLLQSSVNRNCRAAGLPLMLWAPGILYAFSFLLFLMTQEDRYSYYVFPPFYREGNQDAQLVRTQTQAFFSKTQALS